MIKEITKDTLDGVYDGVSDVKNISRKNTDKLTEKYVEIEGIVKEAAEAMVIVAIQEGENALSMSKESAEKAKVLFNNASTEASHSIDKIEDKVKEQMEAALKNLSESKKEVRNKLESIGDALKDYTYEKKNRTSETISNALHKTAEKSKDAAIDLMSIAKSYSKQLTNHSLSKVSDWLKNISNKVNS